MRSTAREHRWDVTERPVPINLVHRVLYNLTDLVLLLLWHSRWLIRGDVIWAGCA